MGTVSYDDCDCVPGHYCDCQEYRQPLDAERARTVVLTDALDKAARFFHGVGPLLLNGTAGAVHRVKFEDCPDAECAGYRSALAVLPVDRVGVEPLDVAAIDALRTRRNSLGKLAPPKGLMEWAVQDAWDAPGVRTDLGDPEEGIVMTDLANLADAICDALAAHLIESPTEGET